MLKYSSSSGFGVLEEKSDDNILALAACLGGGSVDCGGVKERASWIGGFVDKRTNKDAGNEAKRCFFVFLVIMTSVFACAFHCGRFLYVHIIFGYVSLLSNPSYCLGSAVRCRCTSCT